MCLVGDRCAKMLMRGSEQLSRGLQEHPQDWAPGLLALCRTPGTEYSSPLGPPRTETPGCLRSGVSHLDTQGQGTWHGRPSGWGPCPCLARWVESPSGT